MITTAGFKFRKRAAAFVVGIFCFLGCPVFSWAGVLFDLVDDQISVTQSSSINDMSPLSFSFWMYPQSIGENNSGVIFRKGPIYCAQNLTQRIYFGANFSGTDLFRETVNSAITYNAWNQIVVTWDGSATASNSHIYVNGTEASYNTTQNATVTRDTDAADNLYIGAESGGVNDFDGKMTELAFWNVVLSAAQIEQLAKSRVKHMPLQVSPANLKAYWPLDEASDGASGNGTTFKDLSGNANSGTGDDGANNTGLTGAGEIVLTYP